MSARIITMAALLGSIALQPAVAQSKTDFSGNWKVNAEKSDPMGGGGGGGGGMSTAVTTITQAGGKLTVETKFGDQTRTSVYNLDGSESTNTSQRGESKSKAHWDGDALVIETTSTFNGPNGAVTTTSKEVRTLSADGKVMTVVRTGPGRDGVETTRKTVYDKQ
jgi:hypothetical protein